MGLFQKRQVLDKAMPKEVQELIDQQVGSKQLVDYNSFLELIETIATNSSFKSTQSVHPLVAPMSDPTQNEFALEDWIAWLDTDEGVEEMNNGTITDTMGVAALCSRVKGGKGSKGKGEGGKHKPQRKH